VIAGAISNLGPLAKEEWRAGTPVEVAVVEVNHDIDFNNALGGVHCAKEINPPVKIIALCCCPTAIAEAINTGCVAAFLSGQDYLLPKAISNITSFS
jgi:hypothetical protein